MSLWRKLWKYIPWFIHNSFFLFSVWLIFLMLLGRLFKKWDELILLNQASWSMSCFGKSFACKFVCHHLLYGMSWNLIPEFRVIMYSTHNFHNACLNFRKLYPILYFENRGKGFECKFLSQQLLHWSHWNFPCWWS